ncbi:MAG: LPS assembly protein LptD [Rickettsiales bacterium]|jgi:LPS-assembly protein|nr:LPS assembly protein LptD [Rickettsiales bacterium]
MKILLILFLSFSSLLAKSNDKVSIEAKRLQKNDDSIIAIGDVDIKKENYIIKADKVIYDTKNKEIKTNNDIKMYSSNPEQVFFAASGNIKEDFSRAEFKDGIFVLKNGSILRAPIMQRENNLYKMADGGNFSICPTDIFNKDLKYDDVKDKSIKDFNISGSKIELNKDTNIMEVWNGIIWFYGVPIFYSPYIYGDISNKTNQTGFDTPGIEKHSNYGWGIFLPYKILTPDYKIKITPKFWSYKTKTQFHEHNYLLNLKFSNSNININADLTNDNGRSREFKVEEEGKTEEKSGLYKRYRGLFESDGEFNINNNWKFSYYGEIISDRYYMRDYYGSQVDYTVSNATLENADNDNYNNFTYFRLNNIFYQEMNKSLDTPIYMPIMDFNVENEYLQLSVNSMTMDSEYNRVSFVPKARYILETPLGIMNTNATFTANMYEEGQNSMSQFNFEWSKNFIVGEFLIKPIVKYSHSKSTENRVKVNKDSNPYSLSFINIFSDNRLIGYDRAEYGSRVIYGLEGIIYNDLTFGIAQSKSPDMYEQLKKYKLELLGFNDNEYSDYVGYIGYMFNQNIDLYYKFIADKDTLEQIKKELTLSAGYGIIKTNTSYLMEYKEKIKREQLTMTGSLKLTKTFTLSGSFTRDMPTNQVISSQAILMYDNDCYLWTLTYKNENPTNGLQRNESIGFYATIKMF